MQIKYKNRLGTKLIISNIILVMFCITLISSISYYKINKMVVNNLGDRAISIVKGISEHIDVNEYVTLQENKNMNTETYRNMKKNLEQIRLVSGAKFLYTIAKEGDQFIYIVDASGEGSANLGDVENGYDEIFTKAFESKEGYIEKEIDITEKDGALVTAYYPIFDKNNDIIGLIGMDYSVTNEHKSIMEFKSLIIKIAVVLFMVATIIGVIISNKIVKPIIQLSEVSKKISCYELDVDISNTQNKDEIGILASSFHTMIVKLKDIVSKIKETDKELIKMNIIIGKSIEEAGNVSEEISASMESMSNMSYEQMKKVQHNFEMGQKLNDNIENMNQNINKAIEKSDYMMEKNKDSKSTMKELEIKFEENMSASLEVAEKIDELEGKSDSIKDIIGTIRNIASQTNMLALNASIEAARAGEHGHGFAVVAEEVRKLAEQSTESVDEVEGIILEILSTMKTTAEKMSKTKETSNDVDEYFSKTKDLFIEIENSISNSVQSISRLSDSSTEISLIKDSFMREIEDIKNLAEETRTTMEEVSTCAEEQSASLYEIIEATETLKKNSKNLEAEINIFKM